MAKGDVSIELIIKMLVGIILLVVLLWAIGAIGDSSFSLLDKIAGWFR